MTVAVIIVAAGRGVRMGAEKPKAFLLLRGVSLLQHSVGVFLSHPRVNRIVAAVPDPDEAARLLGPRAGRITLVRGGATRQDSVRAALRTLTADPDEIILVHDAARPLVTPVIIDAVISAAAESGAAVPAVAPADTVRQVAADGAVEATLPRERLRLAQTPQGFQGRLLREAYERAERDGFTGTDDAALVERSGHRVRLVEGSASNFKITTPLDLALAEAILAREGGGDEGG